MPCGPRRTAPGRSRRSAPRLSRGNGGPARRARLVPNCITLWNTVYLDAAVARLRDEGYPVLDEDVVRLSAYMRRHLNVHGRYSF